MKGLKRLMAIIAVVGFLMVVFTVSGSDYEEATNVPIEERMTQTETTVRLVIGSSMAVFGGVTLCKIHDAEEEAKFKAYQRRKAKFKKLNSNTYR